MHAMRFRSMLAALVVVFLVAPAAAQAASVTVTNDAGTAVPLTEGGSLTISHMAPTVTPALDAGEQRYTLIITGPDGKSAGVDAVCVAASGIGPQNISYAGNGNYAVQMITYADEFSCDGAGTTHNYAFVIAAKLTLAGPSSPILYRKPGGAATEFEFKYNLIPGANAFTLYWAYDAKFGPNGAIIGDYPRDDSGLRNGGAPPTGIFDDVRFTRTGTVSVVAAGSALNGNETPYSTPITLKVVGPFDWSSTPGFTGGKGTNHVIGGEIFEPGVVGKNVSVRLAKGKGKFKPFVTKKIGSNRKLSFKIRKPRGKYVLKYVFKGSDSVVAGAWTQKLTIGKGSSASLGRITLAKN